MKTYSVQLVNKLGQNVSDFTIKANSLSEAKKDAKLHKSEQFKGCRTFVKLKR